MNKDLKKLPPLLYWIKMKICYDRGCNDIGVVITTNPLLSVLGTVLPKSLTGVFSSNNCLDFREVLSEIYLRVFEIFSNEVFMVRDTVKNGQS